MDKTISLDLPSAGDTNDSGLKKYGLKIIHYSLFILKLMRTPYGM